MSESTPRVVASMLLGASAVIPALALGVGLREWLPFYLVATMTLVLVAPLPATWAAADRARPERTAFAGSIGSLAFAPSHGLIALHFLARLQGAQHNTHRRRARSYCVPSVPPHPFTPWTRALRVPIAHHRPHHHAHPRRGLGPKTARPRHRKPEAHLDSDAPTSNPRSFVAPT